MRLGLYLNPIARLRENNPNGEPDPVVIAALAENVGSQLILAGWVPSTGLLVDRDIHMLREVIHGDLIIVTTLSGENVDQVVKFQPDGVILVGTGWDGLKPARTVQPEVDAAEIAAISGAYRSAGLPPSILVDPTPAALKSVARCGLVGIVLDCSAYASARSDEEALTALLTVLQMLQWQLINMEWFRLRDTA
jgi:pyridoxine 5-phosphate synthase